MYAWAVLLCPADMPRVRQKPESPVSVGCIVTGARRRRFESLDDLS